LRPIAAEIGVEPLAAAGFSAMKLTPLQKLAVTPLRPRQYAFAAGIVDSIIGRKKIGEMTADEYQKLAAEVHKAVQPRKKSSDSAGR
jgi:hypothetical protein